jgi:uncharacterized membrane protein YccC
MPSTARLHAPDLSRLPIAVNLRAISVAEGLRAGLSVAVIIAGSEILGIPVLREAALAALLTCICDPGGPIRRRVPVLITFVLMGAAITATFGILRAYGPAVALPVGIAALFCASFARIYGQAAQQAGTLLGVVAILSLDQGIPTLPDAALLATAFVGGGIWATVLTMAIWRIYPFLPVRRSIGEAYRTLSVLVENLRDLSRMSTIADADWEAHARMHRGATREAIELARSVILDVVRARGATNLRAGQALIRLETADQIFGGLIALSDLMELVTKHERGNLERILRRMRPLLLILGNVIVDDDPVSHRRIERTIDAIATDNAALSAGSALRNVLDGIIERLRIAQTLSVPANLLPGMDSRGRPLPFAERALEPLRTNLNWESPTLRHALRVATAVSAPLAFTMAWFNPYDHWLTITVFATMQPYFSLAYTRALERIGGTIAGGLIAAIVGMLCTSRFGIAAAMFPLAIAAFAVRAVSFGLFMMALTPLIVLLVETGTPDTGGWIIALARVSFTGIGGLLAVGANFLLWPSHEPDLVVAEVRKAIAAHGAYADATLTALLERTESPVGSARRSAGVEAAMVINSALRRCAARLAVLQHDPTTSAKVPPDALEAWKQWIGTSMALLADGKTILPPRPSGDSTDTLLRIARQIELMAGAIPRLAQI